MKIKSNSLFRMKKTLNDALEFGIAFSLGLQMERRVDLRLEAESNLRKKEFVTSLHTTSTKINY